MEKDLEKENTTNMNNLLQTLKNIFKPRNQLHMLMIEKYLAESSDLVDLEQRQQQLARKGIWL